MAHKCRPECVTWTGTNKAHCASCGETFTCVANFDLHRAKVKGKCTKPADVGLVQNARGYWVQEGEVNYDELFKR